MERLDGIHWTYMSLDIYVDDTPFFIVFTSLESLEESKARAVSETTKSARLGTFADANPDEVFNGVWF